MRIDLHTHSLISDGTDTPAELVRKAQGVGLDVVALTDHDTFDGLDEAVAEGDRLGVGLLRGMELSCSRRGNSVHVLAYGADPANPGLSAEMAKVRDGRLGRLAGVLEKLAELGVPVSEAEVMAQVGNSPSVGRPHIADALIKAGHVRDRQEAFDRFLADGGPAHVPRYTTPRPAMRRSLFWRRRPSGLPRQLRWLPQCVLGSRQPSLDLGEDLRISGIAAQLMIKLAGAVIVARPGGQQPKAVGQGA